MTQISPAPVRVNAAMMTPTEDGILLSLNTVDDDMRVHFLLDDLAFALMSFVAPFISMSVQERAQSQTARLFSRNPVQ